MNKTKFNSSLEQIKFDVIPDSHKPKKYSHLKVSSVVISVFALVVFGFGLAFYVVFMKEGNFNSNTPLKGDVRESQNLVSQDSDGDGLDTIAEMENGTSPDNPDTDSDGMPDGFEVKYNLNPLSPSDAHLDPDEDQLTNLQEYQYQTNPNIADTDSDSYLDGIEVQNGFNPNGDGRL